MPYKVIIAGGRDFDDYFMLKVQCDQVLLNNDGSQKYEQVEIVSGGQVSTDPKTGKKYGADHLGQKYAKERRYPVKPFPADWYAYGKSAGLLRNQLMAKYADALIAFWDGHSKGTHDMITQMVNLDKEVHIYRYGDMNRHQEGA